MRRLIINADDFGLTAGINRAIREAHEQGIVTSATLMANAGSFNDAVSTALNLSRGTKFSVGCHVVLLDGDPLLPGGQVASLMQPGNGGGAGHLRDSLGDFAVASFIGKIKPRDVEAEATAQIARIQNAGIGVSHFDVHKHAHMFPAVLAPLLRAAQVRGIRALRNPFGQVFPLPLTKILGNRKLWKRSAEMGVLRGFAGRFKRQVQAHGLRTTDGTLGVLATGVLDFELFATIVDSIPDGTWEFVCHPGYNDNDLDQVRTRLRESRKQELEVLTSPQARQLLADHDVELISYNEL